MTRLLRDDRLSALLRLVLGIMFLYAAIPKISNPRQLAEDVANYQVLPDALVHSMAALLPAVELAVAAALLLGLFPRGAALACAGMMVMFLAAEGQALARGIDIRCGCFGADSESISPATLIRNVLLLAAAVHVVLFDRGRLSFVSIARGADRS